MKRAFVIGHPVAHSRSPLIHGHWLAQFGIEGRYETVDVAPEGVAAFLAGCRDAGFVGGNVTVPNKEAAFRHLAGGGGRVTPHARRLGAVNTVTTAPDGTLVGDNTDGFGFVASLDGGVGEQWDRDVGTALVLGAGGAARALVAALLDRGVPTVRVANRSAGRMADLVAIDPARVVAEPWPVGPGTLAGADLLVNTTQLGMAGQPPLAIDLSPLAPGTIVADIVYVPLVTPLLAQAARRGLRTCDGLGMLLHQARPGFEAWFGRAPVVTPDLRARIEQDLGAAG